MRSATAADVPALVRVINAAYAAEAFCIEGDRTQAGEIRDLLAQGTFLVAEGDGGLAGSVFLRPEGPDRWYLGLLSVDPPRQGEGLGRALVEAAAEHARRAGGAFLDLTVVSVRRELFPFYRKLGFHPVAVLPFRAPEKLKVPARLVRMTRALVRDQDW